MFCGDQHEYSAITKDMGSINIQCVFRIVQVQCILWKGYKILNKEKTILNLLIEVVINCREINSMDKFVPLHQAMS